MTGVGDSKLSDLDPVQMAVDLVRKPSVTPEDHGALDLVEGILQSMGFECQRLPFGEEGEDRIDNLYARLGTKSPNICFAGHTDVVPTGPVDNWSAPPFEGLIKDGWLMGRGAADMKGAIAAFLSACSAFVAENNGPGRGSISLLITGDEEGLAINGTVKMVEWLKNKGEVLDGCIVGEPTNPDALGEMIKTGRRGSVNCILTVLGHQGHVAYPERAHNPNPDFLKLLSCLPQGPLDEGNENFPPTNLEITCLESGTGAFNVIPGKAAAKFNIRFSDDFKPERLEALIRGKLDGAGIAYDLDLYFKGVSFFCPPGVLAKALSHACEKFLGKTPEFSTTGGTSDARYIQELCPVAEFGLISKTIHAIDEKAKTDDILALSQIYRLTLEELLG